MNVYYLCTGGRKPVHVLDNPWGSGHVVRVHDGDYVAARGRALEHAAGAGASGALVLVGYCRLMQMHRANGRCDRLGPTPLVDHALLLYAERILQELAGVVYLPHVSEVAALPRGWQQHRPGYAMAAIYTVCAATLRHAGERDMGLQLCEEGMRTYTLGDFCFDTIGNLQPREPGSTKSWKNTYEEALRPYF